jgi:hypothetical protein
VASDRATFSCRFNWLRGPATIRIALQVGANPARGVACKVVGWLPSRRRFGGFSHRTHSVVTLHVFRWARIVTVGSARPWSRQSGRLCNCRTVVDRDLACHGAVSASAVLSHRAKYVGFYILVVRCPGSFLRGRSVTVRRTLFYQSMGFNRNNDGCCNGETSGSWSPLGAVAIFPD